MLEFRRICRALWRAIHSGLIRWSMFIGRSGGAQKDRRFGTRHENHKTRSLNKAGELFDLFVDQYDAEAEVIAVEESFTMDLNELYRTVPAICHHSSATWTPSSRMVQQH